MEETDDVIIANMPVVKIDDCNFANIFAEKGGKFDIFISKNIIFLFRPSLFQICQRNSLKRSNKFK